MNMKKLITILAISLLALAGCAPSTGSGSGHIVMADAGWDSIRLHNHVVGFIAENAFDLTWSEMTGSTPITYEAFKNGEIDVYTEFWTENVAPYRGDVESGVILELGVNFNDNYQGIYVPRYVIEGDAARGIEPMAPNLRTVKDLLDYPDLFVDEEEPSKGRIYGGIPGWAVDEILYKKFMAYGFDDTFIYFRPGSDAALSAAIISAYDRGEPIAAYYWEPTWLMAQYDLVLLEDEPFDADRFLEGLTEFGAADVTVAARKGFDTEFPEFTEFLSNYSTSSAMTSAALLHMQVSGDDYLNSAKWFLREYDEYLDQWLTAEQAEAVRQALN